MSRIQSWSILCLSLIVCTQCSCEKVSVLSKKKQVFQYQNPISAGIDPKGVRDCQIFRDNDKWYLLGGTYPHWPREGNSPGVRLYSSDDLLNWTPEKFILKRSDMDPSVWHYDRFWAAEIHKLRGKYYLMVNCSNESKEHKHGLGPLVAVSDTLLGDYEILTPDRPFYGGNDLTMFEDDDGTIYAFWNGSKRMYAAEVDFEKMRPVDDKPIEIFYPTAGTWDGIGIEGPYCIKHKDTYYLFYSSWSRGYEIGYATAKHPLGPWTKYEGNPIYGAQSKNVCKKNNLPYTGDPNCPFRAVGHNEVFTGPDGRLWLSCHGILEGGSPMLVIDPMWFDENDVIRSTGPTWTLQTIEY